MTLRTQLVVAFLLLAVVPLLGVTLYSYPGSLRAYRGAVRAEADALGCVVTPDLRPDDEASRQMFAVAGAQLREAIHWALTRRGRPRLEPGTDVEELIELVAPLVEDTDQQVVRLRFAPDPDARPRPLQAPLPRP